MIEEYRALREEIRSTMTTIIQVLSFSIIATGALLGYIMQQAVTRTNIYEGTTSLLKGGLPFLIPSAILLPCLFIVCQSIRGMMKTGTYIKEFIEPNLPPNISYLKWEKAHSVMLGLKRPGELLLTAIAIIIIYSVLVSICLFFSWSAQINKDQLFKTIFGIACAFSIVGIILGISTILKSSIKYYEKLWRRVKEILESEAKGGEKMIESNKSRVSQGNGYTSRKWWIAIIGIALLSTLFIFFSIEVVKAVAFPVSLIVVVYIAFQAYADAQAEKHKQIGAEEVKK